MKFHSYICDHPDTATATDILIAQAAADFDGRPDVAFVFFTADHCEHAGQIASRLHGQLAPGCLIGCSAEGVIGFDREIERSPGISLLVGQLPGITLHAGHISENDWAEMLQDEAAMRERIGSRADTQTLIAFGDPFTTPLRQMLARLDELFPGLPLVGGMASSARQPGQNLLLLNDRALDNGMVGVTLSGPLEVETIVSQGCRPVGKTFVITKAHDNVIEQLGGRPALTILRDVVGQLPEADQHLLRNGLFIGRVINEYKEVFVRGDFLVRNVIGVEEDTGSLACTEYVRPGQSVQFHVRDSASASEDLSLLLDEQQSKEPAAGGLLFSCNGRGTRMFEDPCHDIGQARRSMPRTPVAGFFAAGELGPVGGRNFVHGHTASFALFRPK